MTDAPRTAPTGFRRGVRIGAARQRPCTVVVCRGCCCGNARKYPGTDHVWQLDRLEAAAAASGGTLSVRTSDCLGPCDQANVIVVQPSSAGRLAGGKATWIGFAMDDDCTDELLDWVTAGGPGVAAPPPTLELQFVKPPREARPAKAARARR
ncbi:(2Fe-2S) ferredoxin domain-containing protein [Streptomyces boluensis]|uniref:(2Fe-2S) ferredoxin domain-containing protein n=1 Tax=Streptomyces boluensis TaxID=1775135 RepID=A0A964UW11_9ACTN|nr:(2Fe-2S) ferredoxin domain-containing protein [Streptomyces boluensis]NBE55767.1 (2Fe-2S) ferredoxin domain-containing protein [Streptomyces boluensis]